jgi:hypothetical protein
LPLLERGVVPEPVVEVEEEDEEEWDELELEGLELEGLELLPVVLDGGGLELCVVDEGGGAAGAQVSESTTAPGGSCAEEIGAPAAIGKAAVWPVASLTVSVQLLAEAIDDERASELASDVPASVIAKISFRLINKSARLLQQTPCASSPP